MRSSWKRSLTAWVAASLASSFEIGRTLYYRDHQIRFVQHASVGTHSVNTACRSRLDCLFGHT